MDNAPAAPPLPVPAGVPAEEVQLHTEALLFAADRPLALAELCSFLNSRFEAEGLMLAEDRMAEILEAIADRYDAGPYPFTIRHSGGGYRFLTKEAYHATILQLNGDRHFKKLSVAAMETLSIVAYRGPVTKSEIEFIRGVSADYALQKLLEKELVVISGRQEDAVGKPLLYMPSRQLLDYLGINDAAGLPQLKDLGEMHYVLPTGAAAALPDDLLPENRPAATETAPPDEAGL